MWQVKRENVNCNILIVIPNLQYQISCHIWRCWKHQCKYPSSAAFSSPLAFLSAWRLTTTRAPYRIAYYTAPPCSPNQKFWCAIRQKYVEQDYTQLYGANPSISSTEACCSASPSLGLFRFWLRFLGLFGLLELLPLLNAPLTARATEVQCSPCLAREVKESAQDKACTKVVKGE